MKETQVQLLFDEPTHTYSDNTGKVYTSVTTLIGQYVPKFDKSYWSMYTSLKNAGFKVRPVENRKTIIVNGVHRSLENLYKNPIANFDAKSTVKDWQDITEKACDRGNKIHNYLEETINESKGDDGSSNESIKPLLSSNTGKEWYEFRTTHDLESTGLQNTYPSIFKVLNGFIKQGCIIYAEKKIYSAFYQVAGMIDVLVVKGKKFCIVDWKTNKDKIHFSSGYYKKVNLNGKWEKSDIYTPFDKRLLAPLENLQECKGVIYSLQLSLYAYLMERWGFELIPNGLIIFHIRPEMTPKQLGIKYMKNEVVKLLEYSKNNKVSNKSKNNIFTIT